MGVFRGEGALHNVDNVVGVAEDATVHFDLTYEQKCASTALWICLRGLDGGKDREERVDLRI